MSGGLPFPFRIGPGGRSAPVNYADRVRDMVELVLLTNRGERINRPDFGGVLMELVFEPASPDLAAMHKAMIRGELMRWLGDVITIERIDVTEKDAAIGITLAYTINRQQRLVTQSLTYGKEP